MIETMMAKTRNYQRRQQCRRWFAMKVIVLLFLNVTTMSLAFFLFPSAQMVQTKASTAMTRTKKTRREVRMARIAENALFSHSDPGDGEDYVQSFASTTGFTRRKLFSALTATATAASTVAAATLEISEASPSYVVPTPTANSLQQWPFPFAFSLLPLAGTFSRRPTIQECVVQNKIWTFDQIQGVVNVNVPVRMTVIRCSGKNGDYLWVHNPVAPTPELIEMMNALVKETNCSVKHIVLATVALEHKATFGNFCSYFPEATCWIQPGQWSFPGNDKFLPIEFLGVQQRGPRLREIPRIQGSVAIDKITPRYQNYARKSPIPEWTDQIDYEMLGPLSFKSVGAFSETAFFHRSTKTLLVTDTVVSVTADPPPIVAEDPRALLFHARDSAEENILKDTPELRKKGWRRMVQFGLVFFPSQIKISTIQQALRDGKAVSRGPLSNLGKDAVPLNLYPWTWNSNDADQVNFDAISQSGNLFCPPILTKLILDREPVATLAWVDAVTSRFKDMQRVIPGHLNNNIERGNLADEFYHAFDVLRVNAKNKSPPKARILAEDLALLQAASDTLTDLNVVAPSQVCDGEPARNFVNFASRFTSTTTNY